jgi:hypothetical protein
MTQPDHNHDYPTLYRDKPVAAPGISKKTWAFMSVAGASGWVLVGLVIYWGVKGF